MIKQQIKKLINSGYAIDSLMEKDKQCSESIYNDLLMYSISLAIESDSEGAIKLVSQYFDKDIEYIENKVESVDTETIVRSVPISFCMLCEMDKKKWGYNLKSNLAEDYYSICKEVFDKLFYRFESHNMKEAYRFYIYKLQYIYKKIVGEYARLFKEDEFIKGWEIEGDFHSIKSKKIMINELISKLNDYLKDTQERVFKILIYEEINKIDWELMYFGKRIFDKSTDNVKIGSLEVLRISCIIEEYLTINKLQIKVNWDKYANEMDRFILSIDGYISDIWKKQVRIEDFSEKMYGDLYTERLQENLKEPQVGIITDSPFVAAMFSTIQDLFNTSPSENAERYATKSKNKYLRKQRDICRHDEQQHFKNVFLPLIFAKIKDILNIILDDIEKEMMLVDKIYLD